MDYNYILTFMKSAIKIETKSEDAKVKIQNKETSEFGKSTFFSPMHSCMCTNSMY